jgi:hypothetical protein
VTFVKMTSSDVQAVTKAYEKMSELLPEGAVSVTFTDTGVTAQSSGGAIATVPVTTASMAVPGDVIHRMLYERKEEVIEAMKKEFKAKCGSEPDALYMNGTEVVLVFPPADGMNIVATFDLETGTMNIKKQQR